MTSRTSLQKWSEVFYLWRFILYFFKLIQVCIFINIAGNYG